MSGCAEPIDLSGFAQDKEVLEIIEKGASVYLTVDSETRLEAGNKKITRLDTGEYYGVEEWEKITTADETTYALQGGAVQFVRASGALSASVGTIGRVSGATITGLTNDRYYRVIAAQPLKADVDYIDYATSVGSTVSPTKGIIELPRPAGHDIVYYLEPDLPDLAEYEIAEISSDGSSRKATRAAGGRIMTTISAETVVHYVFFRDDEDEEHSPTLLPTYELYVLKIGVGSGPPEGTITINFYKNDGTYTKWDTRYVEPGGTIESDGLPMPSMPADPSRSEYTFDGWWTKDGSSDDDWGAQFTGTTVVAKASNPLNLYAKWDTGGAVCTVTFKYMDGATPDEPATTNASGRLTSLPAPTRPGYTFVGWFNTDGSDTGVWGNPVTTSTVFSADTDVYAQWSTNVTVTFKYMDGTTADTTQTIAEGGTINPLPTPPPYSGHTFVGWFDADGSDGVSGWGNEFTTTTPVTADMTVYAQWQEVSGTGDLEITVTYNPAQPTEGLTITPSTQSIAKSALTGAGAVRSFNIGTGYDSVAVTYSANGGSVVPITITAGGVVTLTFTAAGNMGSPIVGNYVISINVVAGGVPYSGTFTLTITP